MRLNFLKIFIFLAMIFGIWNAARAAEITVFSFDDSAKIMQASGSCGGHSVAIYIFAASSTVPFYMAGSECADGRFNFQDNLNYWKILPGDYRLMVYDANSPLSNPSEEKQFIVAEALPEQYLPPEPLNNSTSTEEAEQAAPGNFFTRFLDALLDWFADAILKIKELVSQKITVGDLCIGDTCINEGDLKGFLKEKKEPYQNNSGSQEEKKEDEKELPAPPLPLSDAKPEESAASSSFAPPEITTSTPNYDL